MPGFIQRYRNWCLFGVMAAASLLVTFQQNGLAAVSSRVAASLQANPEQLGFLSASFFYAYAIMQIPAGLLSDTLGPRKSVTLALALASLGTLLFALAESLAVAVAARALMGLGLAVVVVPQLKLMAVWFPVGAYSRLTAIAFAISRALSRTMIAKRVSTHTGREFRSILCFHRNRRSYPYISRFT